MFTRIRHYFAYRRAQHNAWKARQWSLVTEAGRLHGRLCDLDQQIMFTGNTNAEYWRWKRVKRLEDRAHQRWLRRWRKYNYSAGHVRREPKVTNR